MFIDPFGKEIIDTKEKIEMVKGDLKSIFKNYLYSLNDLMEKYIQKNDIIYVLYEDKVFKYNTNFFKTLYISSKDKENIQNLRKISFLIDNKKELKLLEVKSNEWKEIVFSKNVISKKFCSINLEKIEKTYKEIYHLFSKIK